MTIRQRDLQAVVRALRSEGLEVERVTMSRDGAVVHVRQADVPPPPADAAEAWLASQAEE